MKYLKQIICIIIQLSIILTTNILYYKYFQNKSDKFILLILTDIISFLLIINDIMNIIHINEESSNSSLMIDPISESDSSDIEYELFI